MRVLEFAQALDVSRQTVDNWINFGHVQSFKKGRDVYIKYPFSQQETAILFVPRCYTDAQVQSALNTAQPIIAANNYHFQMVWRSPSDRPEDLYKIFVQLINKQAFSVVLVDDIKILGDSLHDISQLLLGSRRRLEYPTPKLRLITPKDRLMNRYHSTLNLSNQDLQIHEELYHNPAPAGIIRISDRVLVAGNPPLFKAISAAGGYQRLGTCVAEFCTEESWVRGLNILDKDGRVTDFDFEGFQPEWDEERGLWLRAPFRYIEDAKLIDFMDAKCVIYAEKEVIKLASPPSFSAAA